MSSLINQEVDLFSRKEGKGLLFSLLFFVLINSVRAEQKSKLIDPVREKAFRKQWGQEFESTTERSVRYLPRFLTRTIGSPLSWDTTQRVLRIPQGIRSGLFKGEGKKMGHQLGESLLNPFATAEGVLSDLGGETKVLLRSDSAKTPRIQYCSINLIETTFLVQKSYFGIPLSLVNPARHTALLVDQKLESRDPGKGTIHRSKLGGKMCKDVALSGNESFSMAIERLICAQIHMDLPYHILSNNCSGHAQDIALISGITLPKIPNFGVGSDLSLVPAMRRKERARVKKECNQRVQEIRDLLIQAENGQDLSYSKVSTFFEYFPYGDARIQLLSSVAKSKNSRNRDLMLWYRDQFELYLELYYEEDGELKSSVRDDLKRIFSHLDQESYDWLLAYFTTYAGLYFDTFHGDPTDHLLITERDLNPFQWDYAPREKIRSPHISYSPSQVVTVPTYYKDFWKRRCLKRSSQSRKSKKCLERAWKEKRALRIRVFYMGLTRGPLLPERRQHDFYLDLNQISLESEEKAKVKKWIQENVQVSVTGQKRNQRLSIRLKDDLNQESL